MFGLISVYKVTDIAGVRLPPPPSFCAIADIPNQYMTMSVHTSWGNHIFVTNSNSYPHQLIAYTPFYTVIDIYIYTFQSMWNSVLWVFPDMQFRFLV